MLFQGKLIIALIKQNNMEIVRTSKNGIDYLTKRLKNKTNVYTDAVFWKIKRSTGIDEISLKLGRYKSESGLLLFEDIEPSKKTEITLDSGAKPINYFSTRRL